MKTKLTLIASGVMLAGTLLTTDISQAGISANVAMTSDYRFRGISQNDQSFAIQGGFDYANDSGFYAGLWSSNVDFQVQTVNDASSELDIYAGFGGEFSDSSIAWDVGFLHYNYPNSDSSLNYNFTEINATLSYNWLTLFYARTSDYFAASGTADYFNVAADFELEGGWATGASIAYQGVEDNSAWGTPDWNEYKVYVANSFSGIDIEAAIIGTDLSNAECFGGSDWCDGTVTVTFSKSFE
jgi:uncharacterized protein (TIGR02001 family)